MNDTRKVLRTWGFLVLGVVTLLSALSLPAGSRGATVAIGAAFVALGTIFFLAGMAGKETRRERQYQHLRLAMIGELASNSLPRIDLLEWYEQKYDHSLVVRALNDLTREGYVKERPSNNLLEHHRSYLWVELTPEGRQQLEDLETARQAPTA